MQMEDWLYLASLIGRAGVWDIFQGCCPTLASLGLYSKAVDLVYLHLFTVNKTKVNTAVFLSR